MHVYAICQYKHDTCYVPLNFFFFNLYFLLNPLQNNVKFLFRNHQLCTFQFTLQFNPFNFSWWVLVYTISYQLSTICQTPPKIVYNTISSYKMRHGVYILMLISILVSKLQSYIFIFSYVINFNLSKFSHLTFYTNQIQFKMLNIHSVVYFTKLHSYSSKSIE